MQSFLRQRLTPALLILTATVGLTGCGAMTVASPGSAAALTAPPSAATAATAAVEIRAGSPSPPPPAVSRASPDVVQRQPPAGSCHAVGRGGDSRPDPRCTPGALNPAVTQRTIDRTICVRGWTETIRPPEWVTDAEKRASLAAYGDHGPSQGYEYDHLIPLELGGAPNDPRNLWPEPGASPNRKDGIESRLRRAVCERRIGLAAAQRAIARDWTVL